MTNGFILGTPYCGSTIIGKTLDCLDQISYVGEVSRIKEFNDKYSLGPPIEQKGCMYCRVVKKDCPIYTEEFQNYIVSKGAGELFSSLREKFKTPIVIEGTKTPQWLRVVNPDPKTTKVIVSVRNPFAFAHSMTINPKEPKPVWVGANHWRDVYTDIFRTLNRLNIAYVFVRYEDFMSSYEETFTKIASFYGLDVAAPKDVERHAVHALGGNVKAFAWERDYKVLIEQAETELSKKKHEFGQEYAKHKLGEFVDEKWMHHLSNDDLQSIIETPGLLDLATLFGYKLVDSIQEHAKLSV